MNKGQRGERVVRFFGTEVQEHMVRIPDWSSAAPRLRTVCFLAAMIPVAAIVFILSLVSLVIASPWIVRLILNGSHINSGPKLPWHKKRSV